LLWWSFASAFVDIAQSYCCTSLAFNLLLSLFDVLRSILLIHWSWQKSLETFLLIQSLPAVSLQLLLSTKACMCRQFLFYVLLF